MIRCPPVSTLFPYTTLFRSGVGPRQGLRGAAADVAARDDAALVAELAQHPGDRLRHRLPRAAGQVGVRVAGKARDDPVHVGQQDRKSTRLNSSHANISYAVF